ncbi:hypothetical protein YSA_09494 [Pseudomonas putida ND6]|uniref:Uncharacterized protein n=1 Tax=Pseudomonas putida ND6 TaxID=231023 RepID=I3V2E1_PSEPU|nr:hypothetical protein YSA_09494 [Pseudomonas putida ND6]
MTILDAGARMKQCPLTSGVVTSLGGNPKRVAIKNKGR